MAVLGFAVLGIDGETPGAQTLASATSITRGEQPTVFSLKSSRSLPARPPVGGEYGRHLEDGFARRGSRL